MKYSIYTGGSQTGSGSTDGGSSGKSELGPFTFWSPSSDCPTTYTNMNYPIVGWNNSSAAQMNAGLKMPSAGYVNAIATNINGGTNGINVAMQMYKNGTASGLLTSGSLPTNSSSQLPLSTAGGATYSFAIGDVLSVYIQAAGSGINQSFSAFLELVLT